VAGSRLQRAACLQRLLWLCRLRRGRGGGRGRCALKAGEQGAELFGRIRHALTGAAMAVAVFVVLASAWPAAT
jgi:hypothetical protein